MRLVMLRVEHFPLVPPEAIPNLSIDEELFLDPQGASLEELVEAAGRHPKIRLENALELQQWFIVETNIRETVDANSASSETIFDCVSRKGRITLFTREPLFLGSRNDFSVSYKTRCAVMIKGRDTKDIFIHYNLSLYRFLI
jgi:hypothetical protein